MSPRRSKHIRKVPTFRFVPAEAPKSKESLVRIRSLVNMLTSRAGRFVDVGRNVSVDEASITCRSKYARDLIVFNAPKPTGEYHFKFCICCCSTSWIAVNFRVHCASSRPDRITLSQVRRSRPPSAYPATWTAKMVSCGMQCCEVLPRVQRPARVQKLHTQARHVAFVSQRA
ncbi:TPA: hypothetical protein N0F65_012922 [Lagenidium giganteum]|uniref:PiggyBac transposable element-derived protein domain-containing protein n=1 Tax=Lagenidium giganteum TaxID=4803 RepID=A0AAV2Z257_9STRA|nr:TPA: hypothetical protein N0F65_012922 [Lagenidium giganteum]